MKPRPGASPQRITLRRKLAIVALGVALVVALVVARWQWQPPVQEDSQRGGELPVAFSSPYRNVPADVQYVGDAACAACHAGHAESYRQHPMGRSVARVADILSLERLDAAASNPFEHSKPGEGYRYRVEVDNGRMIHRETRVNEAGETLYETAQEVQFAVGSGSHGRSYLVDRDGFLFMSPITWYPQKQIWAMSPGYEKRNQHFTRPILTECLFCHTNFADHVPDTINRYRPPIFRGLSIGCERCHGPGELHVSRHERGETPTGDFDDTIVNPADLESTLRDAVCQQCHLGGDMRIARRGRDLYDFRPGMPWQAIAAVYVKQAAPGETSKITGHVEQMHASRCYLASQGRLGCISCHDPHVSPQPHDRADFYRTRCLTCHAEQSCSEPDAARRTTSPPDYCVACHMPAIGTEISHAAISDHRIVRLSSRGDPVEPAEATAPRGAGLKCFHEELIDPQAAESQRDWAVAMVRWSDQDQSQLSPEQIAALVADLRAATARDPGDLDAWEALGHALWWQKQVEASLRAFETVLAASPQREFSLYSIASRLQQLHRYEAAARYWQRAIAVNPWVQRQHQSLALALAEQRDWTGAAQAVAKAVELFPGDLRSRQLLVESYLGQNQLQRAEAEFEQLMKLEPRQPERLRLWFENHPARKPASGQR